MQFRYPARLQPDHSGEIIVSFRDLPECLTSGMDEAAALMEARDALEEAIAGRIDDGEPIPVPSLNEARNQIRSDSVDFVDGIFCQIQRPHVQQPPPRGVKSSSRREYGHHRKAPRTV